MCSRQCPCLVPSSKVRTITSHILLQCVPPKSRRIIDGPKHENRKEVRERLRRCFITIHARHRDATFTTFEVCQPCPRKKEEERVNCSVPEEVPAVRQDLEVRDREQVRQSAAVHHKD